MHQKKRRQLNQYIVTVFFTFTTAYLLYSCETGSAAQNTGAVLPAATDTDIQEEITTPPADLHLNSFYKKYLNASGIPIISSANVPDEALFAAQKTVNIMISANSDILEKMIEFKMRVGILGITEVTTDLPEFKFLKTDVTANWDELRGLGAEIETPIISCAQENILCYGEGKDPYYSEDILIHEFAHAMHTLGLSMVDSNFDTELSQAFQNAHMTGLWQNTYAATNEAEYFAEAVQCWFNLNTESIPADGIHNEINTRDELQQYDPAIYKIIARYFPSTYNQISCHQQIN